MRSWVRESFGRCLHKGLGVSHVFSGVLWKMLLFSSGSVLNLRSCSAIRKQAGEEQLAQAAAAPGGADASSAADPVAEVPVVEQLLQGPGAAVPSCQTGVYQTQTAI